MSSASLLDDLTPPQREAVTHRDGPLLVVAGPGSGKTRVVTRRIAHLVQEGVRTRNILAITFTNKAAKEMQSRVDQLLPDSRIWISTFHRFCARLLRQYGQMVGLESHFTIYDDSDQRRILKAVLDDEDIDPSFYTPEKLKWRIGQAKNDLLSPEDYRRQMEQRIGDHWQIVTGRVYKAYQKQLLAANAVDYDDLLMHVAVLLTDHSDLREELDERYRHVLIDEYQDTNLAQYRIAVALSQNNPNLCATGDPDQSIYGWRGARIENILRFERDFPQAKVVRLEANFRSTKAILRSADALIQNNTQRRHKQLFTDNPEGEAVELLNYFDGVAEADGIARKIRSLAEKEGRKYHEFAILFRTNSLSRQIEIALHRNRVPFQMAAGFAYFDRAEVKDLLAYLRLILNPADRAAFARVVNTPLRGLGETSQYRLLNFADSHGLHALEACQRASEVAGLSSKAALGFRRFGEMIAGFSLADAGSIADLLQAVIDKSGFTFPWKANATEQNQQKLDNVGELISAAKQYDESMAGEGSLEGFLEQTALINDTDSLQNDESVLGQQVTLMTLHSAKGLEFPVVFIVGVEEGLLPHARSARSESGLEEERRLFFVGMTRAEQRLYFTVTQMRVVNGRPQSTIGSPFLSETVYVEGEHKVKDLPDDTIERPIASRPPVATNNPPFTKPGPITSDGTVADRVRVARQLIGGNRLITAAALLETSAEMTRCFQVGMQVRHPRHGVGTVIDTGESQRRATVTVRFSTTKGELEKQFVEAMAPLQIIGT